MAEFENDEYYMSGGDENEEDENIVGGNEDTDDDDSVVMGDDETIGDEEDEVEEEEEEESENENSQEGDMIMDNDDSSYYESSDDEIENKVDDEFKENFIHEIHPEEIYDDYNLVKIKAQIQRNELNLIIDDNHTTLPLLTKYERARILGLRISQLNKGARPYIQINHTHIIDTHIIAEQELKEKRLPFIIMRPLPNGKKEYWKLEDLEIIEN